MHSDRIDQGFTLLETLIAFAIMAGGLAVLVGIFGDGLGGARASEARLALVEAAQSRLATVGASLPLVPGTQDGRQGHLDWQIVIRTRTKGQLGQSYLYDVTVTVTDPRARQITLATQRVGP